MPSLNERSHGVYAEGELFGQGLQSLTVNADIDTQIQTGSGIAPDDVPDAGVVWNTMISDDAGPR